MKLHQGGTVPAYHVVQPLSFQKVRNTSLGTLPWYSTTQVRASHPLPLAEDATLGSGRDLLRIVSILTRMAKPRESGTGTGTSTEP